MFRFCICLDQGLLKGFSIAASARFGRDCSTRRPTSGSCEGSAEGRLNLKLGPSGSYPLNDWSFCQTPLSEYEKRHQELSDDGGEALNNTTGKSPTTGTMSYPEARAAAPFTPMPVLPMLKNR
jgi:hypothetical protein